MGKRRAEPTFSPACLTTPVRQGEFAGNAPITPKQKARRFLWLRKNKKL
jgi:hypothetical protein